MRIPVRFPAALLTFALGLMLIAAGCAAPMGQAAGTIAGGAGWIGLKAGKVAWTGGKFAVKTTGRTVIGAAKGIHEEFSPKTEQRVARDDRYDDRRPARADDRVGDLSQRQGATLSN